MTVFDFFATDIYCFFLLPKLLAGMVEEKKAERGWNPLSALESRMKQRLSPLWNTRSWTREPFVMLIVRSVVGRDTLEGKEAEAHDEDYSEI